MSVNGQLFLEDGVTLLVWANFLISSTFAKTLYNCTFCFRLWLFDRLAFKLLMYDTTE